MSRIRYLNPNFFKNEVLAELPEKVRLGFAGLWCWADKEGRLEDRPKRLKAEIFPYEDVDFNEILEILVKNSFIIRYEIDNKKYIQILKWKLYQKPHHTEKNSIIPLYVSLKNKNKIKSKKKNNVNKASGELDNGEITVKRFIPPTLIDVRKYINDNNYDINPNKWYDFYVAKNWMIGKNKMADWKAAVRTWIKDKPGQRKHRTVEEVFGKENIDE